MRPTDWSTFTHYRASLQALDCSNSLSHEGALAILCARDALQVTLTSVSYLSSDRIQRTQKLDAKLKQHSQLIDQTIDLALYRRSLPQPPAGWWWYLDKERPPHWLDRYDWLVKGITFLCWTISIALLVNIATRFFSGGPDVTGAVAVILPSLLALIKAKSDLTEAGEKGFEALLSRLKIPDVFRAEAKLISTILLLIGFIFFWGKLPAISDYYNHLGLNHYRNAELSSAESNYQRAIALAPDNGKAHYNLGSLYEDWLRFEEAKESYQVAVSSKQIPRAYNNLARLYILEENYTDAVTLLTQGQQLVDQQLTLPQGFRSIQPEDQYNLLKNLGWARLMQERYQESQTLLEEAISISNDPKIAKFLPNRASAHCILAQAYEHQENTARDSDQWQMCLDLGNPIIEEEDTWMNLAHQYFQNP